MAHNLFKVLSQYEDFHFSSLVTPLSYKIIDSFFRIVGRSF